MSEKLYIGATLKLAPFSPTSQQRRVQNRYGGTPYEKLPCTVIYINCPHRFFRVRFAFDHGSFTESFKFFEKRDYP